MHKRNINIEILRIMSIYLIILGHCIGHSHLNTCHNSANALIINAIKIITIPATNVFVLISSYFLIDSHFKIKRICTLWLQVLFFSMGGGIIQFTIKSNNCSQRNHPRLASDFRKPVLVCQNLSGIVRFLAFSQSYG